MKKIIFAIAVMLSIDASSQTLGLNRFKASEGNIKYMVFNNLQNAMYFYKKVIEDNGFFYKDFHEKPNKDEEVLLSFTIVNKKDAAVLFLANLPNGGYILEVHIIPNDKYMLLRESKRIDGEVFTYYFDPIK